MKNFLIIGGSSGIGKSLTTVLAQSGNQVYATYNQHPQKQQSNIHFSFLNVMDQHIKLDFLPEKLDGLGFDAIIEIDADGNPKKPAIPETSTEIKN